MNVDTSFLRMPVWMDHPARRAALFWLFDAQASDALRKTCIRWLDSHRLALC